MLHSDGLNYCLGILSALLDIWRKIPQEEVSYYLLSPALKGENSQLCKPSLTLKALESMLTLTSNFDPGTERVKYL